MSDQQSRQEDFVHYVILTRSSGALYLLDDGHDSILSEKSEASESNEEEVQFEKEPKFEDTCETSKKPTDLAVNLVLLRELITELAKIAKGKKYKGRLSEIRRVVGQIEKEILV